MMHTPVYEDRFRQLKACVLIPTYNNAGTLAAVLNDVLTYTQQVIVVNDGSTDNTAEILKEFPQVHAVNYTPNKGKGMALRTGFKEAVRLGYDHAITLDSDGQHYAKDLVEFLTWLEAEPNTLLIGARNMDQENVPGKSSFGNRFSNFWFWVNTGIRLQDTQSGYRSYPVSQLANKRYFTTKYEFEIEVIVRASWSGIAVRGVPVSVYYPKPEERVSHFRPLKDFTRISVLNTVLVLVSVLWVKPRDFIRNLFSREGRKMLYQAIFATPGETNHTKALSMGFGVFMGIVPIWGFQLAVGIPLAILFRMNKALFIVAANISIPPIMFVIIALSVATGKLVLGMDALLPDIRNISLEMVKQEGAAFFLGGTILAVVSGVAVYLLSLLFLSFTRRKASK
jgi:glycosyltransferase involved in cell wall biosynthesis